MDSERGLSLTHIDTFCHSVDFSDVGICLVLLIIFEVNLFL